MLLLILPSLGFGQGDFFNSADSFFSQNVDEKGMVAYHQIRKEPSDLNILYNQIAEFDLESSSPEVQKAFLINAYNILVIKQVVDLPNITGPLEAPNFFNGITHKVGGNNRTLDDLEKETLYKNYPDPRLHFALVCAAISCPPLSKRAYFPENLNDQLDDRSKYVLNLPWFIVVNNNEVQYSQIFNWYKEDFGGTDEKLLKYVNQFRNEKIKASEVGYYEYNWDLNIQKF